MEPWGSKPPPNTVSYTIANSVARSSHSSHKNQSELFMERLAPLLELLLSNTISQYLQ